MEKIICEKCKNAYLQKNDEGYFCSSCGMFHSKDEENLLLGIHYYKEGKLTESADYLMKAIVSDGSNYKALIYKALGDGFNFDEDSTSLEDVYKKIIFACELVPDSDFPAFLEIANDETEKLEKALARIHIDAFESADAEKIKSIVTVILGIQEKAKDFRNKLADFADAYNKRNGNNLVYNLSKGFLVTPEIANEIGAKKLNKIKSDIASHTVFTGILTTDIRNLEIYYRCIVMFFEKNKDKYDFLMENAENFVLLASVLEEGNYNSIQGTASTAEKLKITAYSFFEESLKAEEADNDEPQKSVIILNEDTASVADITDPQSGEEVSDEAEAQNEAEDEAEEDIITIEEVEIEPEEKTEIEEITDISGESTEIEEVDILAEAEDTDSENAVETSEEVYNEVTEESSVNEEPEERETYFKNTPPHQQAHVSAPILEADTVVNLPNTDVVIGNIFSDSNDEASFNYSNIDNAEVVNSEPNEEKPSSEAEETDAPASENEEISAEEKAKIDTAKTKEYGEINIEKIEQNENLTQEEKDDIVRHERLKRIKGVNTETEEFQSLAKKFDRARKNDPDRETTLVPKKNNKPKIIALVALIIVAIVAINLVRFLPGYIAETRYNSAVELVNQKNYTEAIEIFQKLGEYQDSAEQIKECQYQNALLLIEAEDYEAAKPILEALKGYNSDIETKIQTCDYAVAKDLLEAGKYDEAQQAFKALGEYGDSADMVKECSYRKALSLIESKKYEDAIEILSGIKKYSDANEKLNEAKYLYVTENLSTENKTTVKYLTELAKANYRNSKDLKTELLGASTDASLKFFVNTSSTDTTTSLDTVSHTGSAYFHVIALDKEYYGETLTLKYRTQYNYNWSDTVTFSEDNTSTVVVYPPTTTAGYTVTFSIVSADGTTLGSQVITIS